jgi:hypothetical protein
MQSVPVDIPSLVVPSLDKLDIPTFTKDLPKWMEWLRDDSYKEFHSLLMDLNRSVANTSEAKESDISWPLLELTEGQANDSEDETNECNDIFSKDQQNPQVCTCVHMHDNYPNYFLLEDIRMYCAYAYVHTAWCGINLCEC